MELRHLRYFVAVAEELHFTRAAHRLNISAPTLSNQIKALEAILGAQLLSRRTRSAVVLTQTGKRFLEEARATLRQADNAQLVGKRAARGDIGTIAVGYILSASCIGLLPALIASFRKEHPSVSFQISRMETFPQMKAVIDGRIDISIVAKGADIKIADEISLLKGQLQVKNLVLGDLIGRIDGWSHSDKMTLARIEAYKVNNVQGKLSNYEQWVGVFETPSRYYFVRLLTIGRQDDFLTWARNVKAYRTVISSLEPLIP